VTITQDSENCGNNLKVESITFESPGQVDINDNTTDITQIPESFSGTDALTADYLTIEPGIDVDDVVSFKLSAQFNNDDKLKAVCVTDIESAENVVFEDYNNGDQNGNNSRNNNNDDGNSASQGIG
jgi:hypothetical protein